MSQSRKRFLSAAFVIMVYVTASYSIFCGAYMVVQLPGHIDTIIRYIRDQTLFGGIVGTSGIIFFYGSLFALAGYAWVELFQWQRKAGNSDHAA